MTGEIVSSILEETPEAVERRLAATPAACALVEIRADRLRAPDVAGLVARAGRPVLVTVRGRERDDERAILLGALAAGAAFVDVAWQGPLSGLAGGEHRRRAILSHHGATCETAALRALHEAMRSTGAARLKIVPEARSLSELGAVRELLARAAVGGPPLCAFAQGAAGTASRVLALSWGSWGTYGAAAAGRETAAGQLTVDALLEIYRVRAISDATRRFGIAGSPVGGSLSPVLHAAAFRAAELDAVYLPLDTAEVDDLDAAVDALHLSGFGVTMPLKERVASRCVSLDRFAACGSVNTVVAAGPWRGFNTDAPAALSLIGARIALAGAEVAIAGAGGTARAIAAALREAGASVTVYSRGTAELPGVRTERWESLAGASWEALVQATPLGAAGEEHPAAAALKGRMVLDAAYGPQPTPLVVAARKRGLAVADGLDLLAAQAVLQFQILTGRRVDPSVFAAAAAPYRARLGA